jgi:hypothetical protein
MEISKENKMIAKQVLSVFGGKPQVNVYRHDHEKIDVDIIACQDRPCDGVTSFGTIRLSDFAIFQNGKEFPTRIELIAACASYNSMFPNIMASVAFCIIRSKMFVQPGSVLPNYVKEYYPESPLPHVLLTTPLQNLWDGDLKTTDLGSKKVSWLMMVPISEGEFQYLQKNGSDGLESLFEENQIDIFDLDRESVV